MIKTIDAVSFFTKKSRPGAIPADAPALNWTALVQRASQLEPARYPLESLKAILRCEHELSGAGENTLSSIETIDNDTVFVVCGQQAGLFGGPLYTLYKALHSIQLASRLSEACGRKVLPLFWIASDDHDFDEVRVIGIRTADGNRLRAEYTPSSFNEGMPVGEIILDEGIKDTIQLLSDNLPPGDRSDRYLEIIRSSWRPGIAWADAFAAQMMAMCASFGLIMINPRWSGIRELFRHIMNDEIKDPLVSSSLLNEEADKFGSSKKRRKALRKPEGSTNLFMEVDGKRFPLRNDGTLFHAGTSSFNETELLDLLRMSPGRFSPAAALRPVCQDAFLPVAALISGSGERLYLEQLRPLYEHFGVDGSIVWPRASFTLIDQRVVRTSQKEQIQLDKLFENPERIRSEYAEKSFPEDLKNEFDSLAQSINQGFGRLANRIAGLDQTLVRSVEKNMGKVLHAVENIREQAIRANKASAAITEKRFASAIYFLQPECGPQERWFGADTAFIMLGEEGLIELTHITSPGEEHHRLVFTESHTTAIK